MMTQTLDKLTIRGFKSIRELEGLELKNLNILIGANGSGKSNLIAFLEMLKAHVNGNMERYVVANGGVSNLIYNGRKGSKKIESVTFISHNAFSLNIEPGADETLFVTETSYSNMNEQIYDAGKKQNMNRGLQVAEKRKIESSEKERQSVNEIISDWKIYHFHDSSSTAAMRHAEISDDNEYLRHDGSNIAPFLLRIREENPFAYKEIYSAVRFVSPFIEDFILKPKQYGQETKVSLTWKSKGSDFPMQPYHLSDGCIRFICLATALLQPKLPPLIVIDEPELGLHPEAIHILNEFIEIAAKQTQVLVATQSPLILDYFEAEDVVVVKRDDGQSTFQRLDSNDYRHWLEEYTIGGLWLKNVIEGGVSYEP